MPCRPRSTAGSSTRRRKSLKHKDKDRYHCPFPGCARSCAELWRLKVHYRAPSNIRGSGVERGHGVELEFCPKCKEKLEVGKNHGQCRPPPNPPLCDADNEEDGVANGLFGSGLTGEEDETLMSELASVNRTTSEKGRCQGAIDSARTADELTSFGSRSSRDSGHPISASEEHELSVFSSPSLTEAFGLVRPGDDELKEADLIGLNLEADDVSKGHAAVNDLFGFDSGDEAALMGALAPAPGSALTQPCAWPGADLRCSGSRLRPLLEPLDLAACEAKIVAMFSARRQASAFVG